MQPTITNHNPTTSNTQFYQWENYQCAYEIHQPINSPESGIPLLLIHPIGVGLSKQFWQRFYQEWYENNHSNLIYNPDLLGCGESDQPAIPITPKEWARQLQYFIQTVIKQPVIVIAQGALSPVAIELVNLEPNFIKGIILSGPTAWQVTTRNFPQWKQKLLWFLFSSPLGNVFFRYARTRKFLLSFSQKQLFASNDAVDEEWLNTLRVDAENMSGRYAVFSFLAKFWQRDYSDDIAHIQQPSLVVVGETASSISKEGKRETPDERIADYLACLPNGKGMKIKGRNVLPYESTANFVAAISSFVNS